MSDIKEYEDKMKKSVDSLKEDYTTIRAGRANPHILDKDSIWNSLHFLDTTKVLLKLF